MERNVFLVKAFTQDKTQGNPAGVMLDADNLTDAEMLAISSDLGFSESAFVQTSDAADFKVRFCSPKEEVSFCGHNVIAVFHTLMEQGMVQFDGQSEIELKQETLAGILPVFCHKDGFVVMVQKAPEFGNIENNRKEIAKLLSIPVTEILDYPIQTVSTGTPKLMIPVSSLDTLKNIKPDLEGIAEYCKRNGTKGFYPFTSETIDADSDFHARQFNPLAGINEDPITGVAAGALGCYVTKYNLSDKKTFVIEQGYVMSKGGKIFVDVMNEVKVGGYAVTFGEKEYKSEE